jgi:4-hydroxybenzoate polyprenyltransferase
MPDSRAIDRLASLVPSAETRLGYLLRLSRPRFWLYLAGPVLVGIVFAASQPAALVSPLSVALFAYFLVPANVFLYGVNDVFDVDVDAHNPKKDDSGPEVSYREDRLTDAIILGSGLLALPFALVVPPAGLLALGGFLVLAVEYSAPPLRFKTTPVLDSLSNGLYVLPGVVAYAALAGTAPPLAAIAGGWLWTMAMHTFSAIPDIDPDRAAGIQTTATWLGERPTFAYCALLWAGAAVAFGTLHVLAGALLAVYPVLVVAIALADVDVARAYWWYPAINTVVGTLLSMGGIWVMLYG